MSVTLNLRVSGDKRKPSMKQCSGREENISNIIKTLRKTHYSGFKQDLDDLQFCTSIEKQLMILKKITNEYIKSSEVDKEALDFCSYVLVEIYLSVELKSPLKSGIARILNGLQEAEAVTVKEQMCERICDRLNQENMDVKTFNEYSNTLIASFESFPLGSASVLACKVVVVRFINRALRLCSELLCKEMSPTQKLDVCQCVHSVVRIAVCVVQKTSCPDLEILKSQALSLICMEDLPLDTRTNCGFLTVLCCKQGWIQLLTEFCATSSDITKLCLYSGILNTVPHVQLEQVVCGNPPTQVLHVLFNNLLEIHNRNPTDCIVVLSVSRITLLLSRALQHNPASVLPLLPQLLDYTWVHLDHYMDSVRHLATSLLESLVKLNRPGVDVLSSIQERMQETPMWSRAKHAVLSVLIGRIPVGKILTSSPELIPNLLKHLQHQVVASHIVNSYESLMQQHFVEELDQEEWTKLWVRPVILALDEFTNVALQQVLAKAVKTSPQIVKEIIHAENINISTILSCLLVSRRLGLLDKQQKENSKWKGLITYQTLSIAFLHHSDKVRLSCLALLVESHKTTEVFTIAELQLVKQYITYNLSFQAAASRQQSQGLINKFLVRLKDSTQTLQRDIAQVVKKEESAYYLNEVLDEYSTFCEWLVEFCVDNLFPGANYSRRSTVLQILTICKRLELWPASKKMPHEGDVLLACLRDSYEDNKMLAMQLLVDIPTLVPALQDPQQLVCVMKECISLGASIRPSDSNTAAYLMSTLAAFPFSKLTLQHLSEEFEESCVFLDQEMPKKEVHCCLLVILKHLSDQLKIAEISLLRAAGTGPLYGLLFMVRHLLQQVFLQDLGSNKGWQDLIRRVISISFSCSQAVAYIVNSSSPEGHLPMDFDFDTSELQAGLGEEDSVDLSEVSSQMVLLCSWRTVKEVSLLLGYIAEQAPVHDDEQVGLLEKEDLLNIGDHLTTMLAETKHRGAFEQAYVGFCKLASRLWRFPSSDLHGLPNKWLQETMQEINNGGKLCTTRRSAGVPFMIQALICTELEVKGRSTLSIWMNQLLDMAENEALSPETRTHALNIMRALFRNTQLGEAVSPFVERAIIITVIGFSASTWPERNSATLLLSTLVSRVFGVPRSKSHILSWKNKMTGRIFFQRYPKLFDFFHDQLKKATISFKETTLHPSLYPVLLFLGRLYPSSLEGTDSNLQLSEYIPYIQACTGSGVLKTRTLAAAAMVPLISPDKLPQCLNNVLSDLSQPDLKMNITHGMLLQVCCLLEYSSEMPEGTVNKMEGHCEEWIHTLLLVLENKKCPIVMETLFQVVIMFTTKYIKLVTSDVWNTVSEKLINLLYHSRQTGIGYSLCLKRCSELLLKIIVLCKRTEDVISIIKRLLILEEYEVVYTALDYLNTLLSSTLEERSDISYLESLSFNKTLKSEVLRDQSIAELILNKMCLKPVHTSDVEKVLSVVKVYPLLLRLISETFGVWFFIELCKDEDEVRAVIVLECIRAFLDEEVSCPENDIKAINNLLVQYTTAECSEDCHKTVAVLLLKHFRRLSCNKLSLDIRLTAYTTLLQLQYDDPSTWQKLLYELVEGEGDLHCKTAVLLALALGDLMSETSALDLSKGQVFDKGEVSSYHEEAILSQHAGKHLKTLLHSVDKQFLSTTLSPPLVQFLDLHCGFRADTLASFILTVKEVDNKLHFDGFCCFLKPGYQTAKLRSIKVKNIL